jgi:hypothetical protein
VFGIVEYKFGSPGNSDRMGTPPGGWEGSQLSVAEFTEFVCKTPN